MEKTTIALSFRISKKLLAAVNQQRHDSKSALSEIQYIMALISDAHTSLGLGYDRLIDLHHDTHDYPKIDKLKHQFMLTYMPITTDESKRFRYKTTVSWPSTLTVKDFNFLLHIGFALKEANAHAKDTHH